MAMSDSSFSQSYIFSSGEYLSTVLTVVNVPSFSSDKPLFLLKLCFIKAIIATCFLESSITYKPNMEYEQSRKSVF